MKKILKLSALISVLVLSLLLLLSCTEALVADKGIATVAVEQPDGSFVTFEVDLSLIENKKEGALSLLEYIASAEGSTLYYNVQWGGGYGAYITSINALTPVGNQYIAVYTSCENDFAVPSEWSPTAPTAKYGDITLTYSGVGISSMTIKDGTVVLFRLESY